MRSEHGVSLAYGLLKTLGQSIVTGEYDGKTFPTEAELCQQYGASRTVMREAVKMLSAKGLLSSRQRQGTRIEPVDNWNMLDPDVLRWLMERPFSNKIFREFAQMRLAIEPQAAALAAEVQDKPAIAQIRDGLEGMIANTGDPEAGLQADIDFHVAILKASGNPFFWRLKPLINNALQLSIQLTNQISGHTASIAAHEAVLVAIENGDADAAKQASEAILRDSLKLIETVK
ncbi:galactonate operon transcriptional repressor [Asticcacaulis biprosthecium C19]|uniref:Galactonate operon transcriptional repressor n=1 Tax=Asticcacaulis biprosthecium C19 TaxID=715226 RepID=F4QU01_9CAUL|nr:FadR/GntR family transcriptional regulator [Asticcacaulis biprosthecium]EGF89301.1 galactonate operon transcriptional repressor [Asticcacaulis biprosthecium C19]